MLLSLEGEAGEQIAEYESQYGQIRGATIAEIQADTSLDEWLDNLVRRWAWWLRAVFSYQGYPDEVYEGYTGDHVDEWTAGYLREEPIEPAVREATGFSKLLCDSHLETTKFEYRNDDTCH